MNVATLVREVERLEGETVAQATISSDPVAFARSVGFDPDDWQRELLESESSRIILNCARQSGKSSCAAVIATHEALTAPGSLVLILAPSERQAKECFSKVAGFYRRLGYPVPSESYRKMGMELLNGSRVEALPGTEKTVRGFSGVDLLIVDEASRVEDSLYYAVRPMLAVSGGRLMLMSTPHGRRGVFYETWENGGPEWERYEVRGSECPRIPADFLEAERRSMPEYWFAQEYECEFRDTDDQVFSSLLIEAAESPDVTPTGGFEW